MRQTIGMMMALGMALAFYWLAGSKGARNSQRARVLNYAGSAAWLMLAYLWAFSR